MDLTFILNYIGLGLIVNVYTMFDKEMRGYWFEWGFLGFIIQMAFSVALFPLVLWVLIKEKFTFK